MNDKRKTNDADTVLFDGMCNFCTASVNRLKWLDFTRKLEFLSLHDEAVAVRFPDLTHEMLMDQMWVATADGKRFGGADAFKYLSTRLPALYPLALVMYLPGLMPVWRRLYRLIADRRYKIAGKDCNEGTCSLHRRVSADQ